MPELRWNPLLNTWTMVAANRQKRPDMPKDWCPFCPSPDNDKVPSDYDVLLYPNDFPVLSRNPAAVGERETPLYSSTEAYGQCDVVLYSPKHTARLFELSIPHIEKLVKLWKSRHTELAQDNQIKYIFPFENRGKEVGVTMPHPHGQIYSYSFIPLKIETELRNCENYFQNENKNLFQVMNETEISDGRRMVVENDSFVAYIPHFTDYPFGVFVVAKDNLQTFEDFNDKHINDLAVMLKQLNGGFDAIYDKLFPYMMCIHQAPVNTFEWSDCEDYYRFHIEFYPPLRGENSIKHMASSESGGWAAANTVLVEDAAKILRAKIQGLRF